MTGKDFGFLRACNDDERKQAVDKWLAWWETEGRKACGAPEEPAKTGATQGQPQPATDEKPKEGNG